MTHCVVAKLLKESQKGKVGAQGPHRAHRKMAIASSVIANRKSSLTTFWISRAKSSSTTDLTRKSICKRQVQLAALPKASTGSIGRCQLMLVQIPKSSAKKIENACSKRTKSQSRSTNWPNAKSPGHQLSMWSKHLLILTKLNENADWTESSRRRSKQKST